MLKAYKFRIYPDEPQRIRIEKTFGCSRFIYNRILADAIQCYKETGKSKIFTPAHYKTEFLWLKEVDSMALCNAQLHVQAAYTRFFKKQNQFPQFHKKGRKDSYTTNKINGNIAVKDGKLKLPKLGLVRCVFHRWIKGLIKSVTISKTKSGKYFASILTEQEPKAVAPLVGNAQTVGIDMSMEHLVVLSGGMKAKYPRYYRQYEKRLAFLQRRLSRKTFGSHNRTKYKQRIARLHERITHLRREFQHTLSRQIVNQYDVIVVEGINYRQMSRSLGLGKSVHDIGFGSFRTMLEYKAQERHKAFVVVDKWFPSSKTCSICGYVKQDLSLSERTWQCPVCGVRHDRDLNAANNLKKYPTGAAPGSNACGEDLPIHRTSTALDETGKVDGMEVAIATA